MVESQFHSTTICAVEKNGKFAMAGDGQVTMGESVVMKGLSLIHILPVQSKLFQRVILKLLQVNQSQINSYQLSMKTSKKSLESMKFRIFKISA